MPRPSRGARGKRARRLGKACALVLVVGIALVIIPPSGRAAGGWGVPVLIGNGTYIAGSWDLAVAPEGTAIAAWSQWDGAALSLYGRHFDPRSGWGGAVLLERMPGTVDRPGVAMDRAGNALVVWSQPDGRFWNLYAKRYDAHTGWSGTVLAETVLGDAMEPQIAMNGDGDAIVVWVHWTNTTRIYANRFDRRLGWGLAGPIPGAEPARAPDVGIDHAGRAIALWMQWVAGEPSAYASRSARGAGWDRPVPIEAGAGGVNFPEIAVHPAGSAIAIWTQTAGGTFNVFANRYTVRDGWGREVVLAPNFARVLEDRTAPHLAMDPRSGDAFAVWAYWNGARDRIYGARYDHRGGWGRPVPVDDGRGESLHPDVAADAAGNAIAVWFQSDGVSSVSSIVANRYDARTGWGVPALVEPDPEDAQEPVVGLDRAGNAIAVWGRHGSPFEGWDVWGNRFTA